MPIKPRTPKLRRELTEGEKCHLIYGTWLSGDEGFASEELAKATWIQHRDSLMKEFLEQEIHRGERPWAYWMYDRKFELQPNRWLQYLILYRDGLLSEKEIAKVAGTLELYPAFRHVLRKIEAKTGQKWPEKWQKVLENKQKQDKNKQNEEHFRNILENDEGIATDFIEWLGKGVISISED